MNTVLNTLGASNLSDKERSKLDYYGTDPRTTEALLRAEKFDYHVWEPCVGHHLIADMLEARGYDVKCSDIADYEGYEHELSNFLEYDGTFNGDIVTNPPYNLATEFVVKALNVVTEGYKVCMLLRLQFLEGNKRFEAIFKNNPPETVYVFTNRQVCSKDDSFTEGSAMAYAWIVWKKGYTGCPQIKWLQTK